MNISTETGISSSSQYIATVPVGASFLCYISSLYDRSICTPSKRRVMAFKWALITGVSAGGMGEGHAIALLKRGINVIATSIDTKLLGDLKIEDGRDGARMEKLELDVTSQESIAAAVEDVTKITGGRLDLLLSTCGTWSMLRCFRIDAHQIMLAMDTSCHSLTSTWTELANSTMSISGDC